MKRRAISLLLAIAMVLGLLPAMGTAAFAADVEAWEEDIPEMWLSIIDTRNNRNITERGVALRPGEELTLQVKAQYFDERQVVVPNPQWVTDHPEVVSISGTWLHTSMPGTAKLSVSYTDPNGLTASAFINVKVTEEEGYYVEVLNENGDFVDYIDAVQGETYDLSANVYDRINGDMLEDPFILWRSSDDKLATVTVDGYLEILGAGEITVYAIHFGEDGYDYTSTVQITSAADVNADSDTVKQVYITDVMYPSLGDAPDYDVKTKYSGYGLFTPEGTEYDTYIKNGIAWYDSTEGKFLIPDQDVFEEDRVYDVYLFLYAEDGKVFDGNVNIICGFASVKFGELEGYNSDCFIVATAKNFYTVDDQKDVPITSVSLRVDPPAVGETPDYTVEQLGDSAGTYFIGMPYSKTGFYSGVAWYDVTDGKYMTKTDVFVANHEYQVSIALQPGLGYDMASSDWSVPAVDISLDVDGPQTVTTECYTGTMAAKGFIVTGEAMASANYYPIITDHAMAFNADGELITSAKAGEEITVRHTGYWYQTVNNWSFEPAVAYTSFSDRLVFTMPDQDINIKVIFENTVLSNVRVTVGIPVVGREADFTAVTYAGNVVSMGYQIGLPWGVTTFHNGVQWYDVTADSYLVPGDVFEAGHSYQVSVGIQAEYCHSFSTTSLTGYIPYMGNISVTGVGNQSQEEWRLLISEAVMAVEEHSVTVYNGEVFNDKGEPVTTAAMGDVLTIIAPEIPNRPFKNWEELTNTGIRFGDIIDGTEKATTVVTMPDSDLEIQAVYEKERIESLALELSGYYKGNGAHQMKLTWDNWNVVSFCEDCYENQNYVVCFDNNNNPSSYLYGNMTVGPYWLRVGIRTSDPYTLDSLTEESISITVDGVAMNTVRLERGDNDSMVLYFYLGEPVDVNWNIIWITGGQALYNGYPVEQAPAGAKIDLVYEDDALEGQIFEGWKDELGFVTEFAQDWTGSYSFIMPDSYVSIVPVYTGAIYRVDINMVDPPKDGMRPDYEVELPADAGYELTSDNVFNNACVNGVWWSVEYDEAGSGDVLDPETAVFDFEEGKGQFYTVSFSLAAKDGYWFATNEEGGYILEGYVDGVAANLNYPDNHTKYLGVTMSFYTRDSYSITVEGGNAYNPRQQGNEPTETPITSAYPGDYLKVVADTVEGKTFSHWEIVTGTIKIAEEELASETIWFAMAEEPVELRAVYKSTVPTLTLKSPTLEFKDMIRITAFYTAENMEDVVEMGMITYPIKVDTPDVATAVCVVPGYAFEETSGRYFSSSQGIAAKYLAQTYYLAIYAKLADGTYAYSKLAPYSAVTYATNKLKNSTDVKLKQLVVAMLNYGAEAQLYFKNDNIPLANATLTSNQMALPEAYRADMVSTVGAVSAAKQGVFANNQGFSSRKPAITFEGAFCINYLFTPNYAPDNGITLYYWTAKDYLAADVLHPSNASGTVKMVDHLGDGVYRGDLTGIAAKNISDAVYVAAAYKSGGTVWTSGVLGYSIGAYCSSQASKGGDIANLAMATAVYGYHAKAYFG